MKKKLSWGWVTALLGKKYNWKRILLYGSSLLIIVGLYIFQISSITNHSFSPAEASWHEQSQSLKTIFENPINAPHKIVTYIISIFFDGPIAARLASAVFSIAAVVLLFIVLRKWHSVRTAFFATSIFACSSLMLHVGRWGSGVIALVTIILAIILFALKIKYQEKTSRMTIFAAVILLAMCMYVPGALWFVVLFMLFGYKDVLNYIKKYATPVKVGAGVLGVILAAPLLKSIISQPLDTFYGVIGFQYHGGFFSDALRNLIDIPRYFVFGGYENPQIWLNGIAVLDVLMIVLILLGLYFYIKNRQTLSRFKPLLAFGILTFLLTVIGSFSYAPLLFVSLVLIMAGGIHELIGRWTTVFPRNSLAQGFAITLLSIIIMLSVFYNLRQYFVAWPQAPATKEVYSSLQTSK